MTNSTLRLQESYEGVEESVLAIEFRSFESMNHQNYSNACNIAVEKFTLITIAIHFIFFQLLCCLREQQSSLSIACLCLKGIIALLAAPVLHVKYICGVIFPGNVVMVQTIKMLMDIFAHCNFFTLLIFRIVRLVFIDLCCTHSCIHVMSFSLAQSRKLPMLLLILLYWIA